MGSYRSKGFRVDIDSLPEAEPEPNYEIKTRPPKPDIWALNIRRGEREDELKGLAYAYSRRKCKKYANDFIQCERENGAFWTAFECQEQNHEMLNCFKHEYEVEMDKLRRNMNLNNEWWWRDLYDENGEVGAQAEWKGEYWLLTILRNKARKLQDKLGWQSNN